MGIFNNKELNELVIKTNDNTNDIVAVRRDIDYIKLETSEENKNLYDEISELKKSLLEINNSIDFEVDNYKRKIEVIENEKKKLQEELKNAINLNMIKGDNLTFTDVCKNGIIPNINTSQLKYYLYEIGVMSMSINKERNTFSINSDNLNMIDKELIDCLYIDENKLLFKQGFLDYVNNNKDEIIKSARRYSEKQNQYKSSKKNLESRNVANYRNEIASICNKDGNYEQDKSRWKAIYDIFMIKYPDVFKDRKKYIDEHEKDRNRKITMVDYIVSIMGEGNYLLKITCDLYA